ncbi:diacylglycerol/lipid kinase family protein [Aquirufa sp. ROCK2-A2]
MIHIIFNPKSGSKNPKFKEKIIHDLQLIPKSILHITERRLHSIELTKQAISAKAERIIVIGGDGTINEVASTLIDKNIPLGIIPMGSGNGLARHLHIPLNFNKALQKSLQGRIIEIDAVYFNEKPFFCTAGLGFDAIVAHKFAKSENRGFLNYILSTLQSIIKYKSIEMNDSNSDIPEHLFSITFANANQFGNNAFISPNSNLQDGTFEVVKIQPVNYLELINLGIRLFFKKIFSHKNVQILTRKEFNFKVKIGTPMHLDGENLFVESEFNSIQIKAKAIQIII